MSRIKTIDIYTNILLLFCLIPILPSRVLGLPVIVLCVISLCNVYLLRAAIFNLNFKRLILIITLYLIFVISCIYSENYEYAFKKIYETRLSLLVVPISLAILSINYKEYFFKFDWKYKLGFCYASLVFILIYLTYLFFYPEPENPAYKFPSGFFFKSALISLKLWNIEPVFLSIIIVVSIIYITELRVKKRVSLVVTFILSSFYTIVLVMLVSKIALLFLLVFLIWLFLIYLKFSIHYKLFISFGLLVSSILAYNTPTIRYEISEIEFTLKGKIKTTDDSSDQRVRLLKSSINLVKRTPLLYGFGLGDVQKELNLEYKNLGYEDFLKKKFNSHNQYLGVFFESGLIGLGSLFFFMIITFYVSIKNGNVFSTTILVFFFLQMLTENIFERQLTVILFSFIVSKILFIEDFFKKDSVYRY